MLDLRRLHHALAIAREGSLSAAAESIPLSPSALSRSLHALEVEYGITIFERGRSGAALTPEGRRFMEQAELLLRRAEYTEQQLRRSTLTTSLPVTFGIGSTTAAAYLTTITEHFRTVEPLPLVIHSGSNRGLLKLLQDGELDFYVGGVPRVEDVCFRTNSFAVRRIAGHRVALLVRPEHPLLRGPGACSVDQFDTVSGTFTTDTLRGDGMAAMRLRWPVLQLDNYDFLAGLVMADDYVLIGTDALHRRRPDLGLAMFGKPIRSVAGYAVVQRAPAATSTNVRRVADFIFDLISADVVP